MDRGYSFPENALAAQNKMKEKHGYFPPPCALMPNHRNKGIARRDRVRGPRNAPLTVALTVLNSSSESASLRAYDLDVEFLLENADGTNIAELGRSDWIVRDVTFPVILRAGESKSFGQIQARVRNGRWTDHSAGRGPFPEYKGVGLEVKDAVLEAGYPLETVPGDYFVSVQIRIQKDNGTELKFISEKQKIHINM